MGLLYENKYGVQMLIVIGRKWDVTPMVDSTTWMYKWGDIRDADMWLIFPTKNNIHKSC